MVAAAEVGHHERWQRAAIGMAAVGASARHVDDVLDEVERFVWANPEVEVLACERRWVPDE
jgi:uncharacterized protein YlxP (DUF503 family)